MHTFLQGAAIWTSIQRKHKHYHLLLLFEIKQSEADDHTIHSPLHGKLCSHTQAYPHTLFEGKKVFNKNITIRQSLPMNEFHRLFTLMAFSICHKTILPQQIHSAVHIIIMHLNTNTVWQDMQCQMCVAEYLHTTGERHCSQKTTYMLIYYTLKMHLYAFILPLILLCLSLPLSPALSHVGGSTGHTAMPHQYANW